MPFTKNEKKRRIGAMSMVYSSSYDQIYTMVNTSGSIVYPRAHYADNCYWNTYSKTTTYYNTVCIGSGATPFSEDDYVLEAQIGSGYVYGSNSNTPGTTLCAGKYLSSGEDDDGIYAKFLITGINNTENAFTINEIGVIKRMDCNGSASTTSVVYHNVLLYREVLETPVTVEVGKTYEIVVKIYE